MRYVTNADALAAIKHDLRNLEGMQNEQQTEEVCIGAVRKDAFAIKYIHTNNLTDFIGLVAIHTAIISNYANNPYFYSLFESKIFFNYCKKQEYYSFEEFFNELDEKLKTIVIFNIDLFK